jgi:hypothetical protein
MSPLIRHLVRSMISWSQWSVRPLTYIDRATPAFSLPLNHSAVAVAYTSL